MVLVPMMSHDQKSCVAPHFDNLDLRSAMMASTMLFAAHDTDASANGIIRPRKSCCASLYHLDLRIYNGAIYYVARIM